jgi:hypothetical protein
MPKESKAQGRAAGIALAVKRGEATAKPGSPSAEIAKSMTTEELHDFAKGSERGLPVHTIDSRVRHLRPRKHHD